MNRVSPRMASYFLLGMLIAAALSALLPEEAIPRYLGASSGFHACLLAALVGTCVPTMHMARKVIGRRATVFYAIFWLAFAIGSGVLLQTFLA